MRWIQMDAEEIQYVMSEPIPGCSHSLYGRMVYSIDDGFDGMTQSAHGFIK